MILIFEGCDCSGKSTLIENVRINTAVNWKILNFKYPTLYKEIFNILSSKEGLHNGMTTEQFSSYMTTFYILSQIDTANIIFDRFWVGEFVYCVIRGCRYAEEFEKKWIDIFLDKMKKLKLYDMYLIHVKADTAVIQKRMKKVKKGEYIFPEEVQIIINGYNRVFDYIKEHYYPADRIIEIDTTNKTKRQSICELMKELAKRGVYFRISSNRDSYGFNRNMKVK